MATRQESQSPLLQLPPELRNRIYNFVFEDLTVELKAQYTCDPGPEELYTKTPALLVTCRQVYHEAVGVYYGSTAFLSPTPETIGYWAKSLPAIGKYGKVISRIRYDFCRHKVWTSRDAASRWAQRIVNEVHKDLPCLENGTWRSDVVQVKIKLAGGTEVWTSTPKEAFLASEH